MLEAQEISQKQTDASLSLTEKNILDISIYKGGLSVLIDRYFINCKMTEQDALFYFGFGFCSRYAMISRISPRIGKAAAVRCSPAVRHQRRGKT